MKNEKIIFKILLFFSIMTCISCDSGFDAYSGSETLLYRPTGNIVYLENASGVSNGYGSFGTSGRSLFTDIGTGFIFSYGAFLDGNSPGVHLFDSRISGGFATGRYFRIVENGKNIADASGLNLKIRAMDLSTVVSPPGDECYIDPVRGTFCLPRPIYWSKLEDLANIENPEVGYTGAMQPTYTSSGNTSGAGTRVHDHSFGPVSVQFLNGLRNYAYARCGYASNALTGRTTVLNPFASTQTLDFSAGTFSVWSRVNTFGLHMDSTNGHWDSYANADFGFPDQSGIWVRCTSRDKYTGTISQYVELYVGDTQIGTAGIGDNVVFHLYVQWDNNGIDGGTDTVRVYINGVLSISTTNTLPDLTAVTPKIDMYSSAYSETGLVCSVETYCYTEIDNLKIWNDCVGTNADWVYNTGTGREDALHSIYSETAGYKPVLDDSSDPDSGVGYYYIN